jgi:hypothetical protein
MNVNLIDPNEVNINPNTVNGIPQYQDMYIFAEFVGTRRGRTVLIKAGDSNSYFGEQTGLENTITVNFLGMNQNTDNPNYMNFTTNYYQGSTETMNYSMNHLVSPILKSQQIHHMFHRLI